MNINTLSHKSANLPKLLSNTNLKVSDLYYLGNIDSKMLTVGIIGSRRPSSYGEYATDVIVRELAKFDVCIVSGLAIGIDGLAHKAALRHGAPTWAVLPGSLNSIYPARHRTLAAEVIRNKGALISEHFHKDQIHKGDFIARNRIIAGLCDLLIVVEASKKSGTMHTVRFALDLGVDVAAVPGQINSSYSEGSNMLIRDGAHVIDSATAAVELLGLNAQNTEISKKIPTHLTDTYSALGKTPRQFSDLRCQLTSSEIEISAQLSELEILGLIRKSSDGLIMQL